MGCNWHATSCRRTIACRDPSIAISACCSRKPGQVHPSQYGHGGIRKLDSAIRKLDSGIRKLVFGNPVFGNWELYSEIRKWYYSETGTLELGNFRDTTTEHHRTLMWISTISWALQWWSLMKISWSKDSVPYIGQRGGSFDPSWRLSLGYYAHQCIACGGWQFGSIMKISWMKCPLNILAAGGGLDSSSR